MGRNGFRPRRRSSRDFERIFDASPSPQILLSPEFMIIGVNEAYLQATMTRREAILGRAMFDVFPDNPEDLQANGVHNLRASLARVLATGRPDAMPVQKYDIQRPAPVGGGFEERWWSPINVPVFGRQGQLDCIIHRVEDVSAYVRLGRDAALPDTMRFGHPQALELVGRNRDLHKAMQAQALVNEHLHLALQAGHAGTFAWDNDTGRCHWSSESLALYGLDAFGGRYQDWLTCVLPEDRDTAHLSVQQRLPSGEIEFDFRIRRGNDGAVRWMHVRAKVALDETGKARRVYGIQMDITERRQAEEQMRQQAILLDLAPTPTFVWHEEDGIRYWNRACQEVYGFRPDEALGRSPPKLLKMRFPVSLEACKAELERNGHWEGEVRHTTRDGRSLVVESWMRRLIFNGEPLILEATRDISERKAAEVAIEDSRRRLAAILDSLNEGVVVADLEGHILDMNPVALALHGFKDVAEARRRLPDFIDQFELRSLAGSHLLLDEWPLARVLRGESYVDYELEVCRKDLGQRRIMAYNGTPVVDAAQGKLILAVLTLRDITLRKQAEQELRESEHRLALALKVGGTAVWEMDVASGRLLSADDLLFTMLGYSPWEMGSLRAWLALMHVDDRAPISEMLEDVISGKRETYRAELRLLTKDGHWHWILCQAIAPERDAHGRAIRLLGAHTDIEERKLAESALRDSEEVLRATFEQAAIGIAHISPKGYFLRVNRKLCDMLGYSPEELYQKRFVDVAYPPDHDIGVAEFERSIRGEIPTYSVEKRYQRQDGAILWVRVTASAVHDWPSGRVRFNVVIIEDFSERKQWELDLQEGTRRIQLALEAGNAHVWEMREGNIVLGIEPLAIELGYRPGELQRLSNWLPLIHDDDRPNLETMLDELRQGIRHSCRYETRIRDQHGQWHWYLSNAMVAEADSNGHAVRIVGTYTNIDERKDAERKLRESEQRLALALQASGSAVWELEVDAGIIRGGAALFSMFGYAPGEMKTLSDWLSLVHADDRTIVLDTIGAAIEGRADSYRFEVRLRIRDGAWRWNLSQALVAERHPDGRAMRIVGTHTDITERKAAEAEIRRLNAELEARVEERTAALQRSNEELMRSNLELQHFAYATAHDLQTPLRSIAGFTQLLKQKVSEQGDPEVGAWADQAVSNTLRLQALIKELLSYTSLDAQGLPFEEVEMDEVLGEVLGLLHGLIASTGTEVIRQPLPKIRADRTQMRQLLQNLIENGIKYNQSRPPRLTIACEHLEDGGWVFSVADNGIGIDPRHHERIFELFRRLHTYGQIPGSGIGLALCRRVVERHGGRIWVESRVGQGSTFYFTLPSRSD